MLSSIKVVDTEEDLDALLVSLDAKKAFDSVEHSYIEQCLIKFGLQNFVKIFRILYSELRSDILVNGTVVKGYKILRGVKQGDAHSCVLFIVCMEPLIRNVEKKAEITAIYSNQLQANLPKIYAYADDVNCLTVNTRENLQLIFKEYERLSRKSGLELNANKTEILRLRSRNLPIVPQNLFRIQYSNQEHRLETLEQIKINGIVMCQEETRMRTENVDIVCGKINNQLKRWSCRNLSILGKILVVKTFGVSQIIYLSQSMQLSDTDFKKFNQLLYKFIWNRHYLAAKAPERLRRDIVNKPMKQGGLGMLDISELDASLKLKALGRLETSKHPMLSILRTFVRTNFFYPGSGTNLDCILCSGLNLLKADRLALWAQNNLRSNRYFIAKLREIKLSQALSENGRNSLAYLYLRNQNKVLMRDLTRNDLQSLTHFLNPNLVDAVTETLNLNPGQLIDVPMAYYDGVKFSTLSKLTSKQIRTCRSQLDPACVLKLGPILTPLESINLFGTLTKLSNTRHKDILLRLIHGELYSKERLHRYGLVAVPFCPRCNQVETLKHKYLECGYVKEIWRRTLNITDKLKNQVRQEPLENKVINISEPKPPILTIHAEIILEIRRLKDDAPYQLLPKILVSKAVERVSRRENNWRIKRELSALLS